MYFMKFTHRRYPAHHTIHYSVSLRGCALMSVTKCSQSEQSTEGRGGITAVHMLTQTPVRGLRTLLWQTVNPEIGNNVWE